MRSCVLLPRPFFDDSGRGIPLVLQLLLPISSETDIHDKYHMFDIYTLQVYPDASYKTSVDRLQDFAPCVPRRALDQIQPGQR